MILIHTALQSEAQYLIEYYKLKKKDLEYKAFSNEHILLLVGGMGKENTISSLSSIFDTFDIKKAINIGITGCSDNSIEIGELFCTNQQLEDIKFMNLQTVDTPQLPTSHLPLNTLYDMEAKYFEDICLIYLEKKDIYIFKVVSDYLDNSIPSKEFVKQLIKKNIKSLEKWI